MNKQINDWKILYKIGEGKFSKVYKIEKIIDNQKIECALKHTDYSTFLDDEKLMNSIRNELEIINKINGNENIITYYDFLDNENAKSIFIVMELLTSLKNYYTSKEIEQSDVIEIGKCILKALQVFHSNGLLHNDVKPSNIFVAGGSKYKLGDFNIAIKSDEVPNYGTPSYMAPEALMDEKDNRADIYSLGLTLYSLLNNGKIPFEDENISSYQAINIRNSGKKIPNIKGINKKLMGVILKALEFDKNKRYANVEEMFIALNGIELKSLKPIKKKTSSFTVDDTLDINSPLINNSFFTKFENLKTIYSTKALIKKTVFWMVFIIGIVSVSRFYLLNRYCKEGFVNKNGFCVKGFYSCKSGYKLSKNKCIKVTEQVAARENYYCPDNYILSNGHCVNKNTVNPTFTYKCADGFTLRGTQCMKEESAEAPVIYTCPNNYVLAGTKCVTANSRDAQVTYTCPDSTYTRNGTQCSKNTESSSPAIVTYGCPRGGTLSGTKCDVVTSPTYSGGGGNWWWGVPTTPTPTCTQGTYSYTDRKCHYSYDATKSYTCTSGVSNMQGQCIKKTNVTINALKTYHCPINYITVGNKCTSSQSINATPKYTCSSSTKLVGNMCYGTITTQALGLYTCPDGYLLSGTTCLKDDFKKPITKHTCSRLYKLNDNKCEKYETVLAKANYE